MDYTTIHPACSDQAHHIDLHLWRGAPQNLDEARPIQVLVNHGYVVGFSPERLQPAWSAYRVAFAEDDVDYDRPIHYHDDLRLDEKYRIGRKTYGKIGAIQLNVGHMSPNEVINRQFGRLAQLETFLMSNMSPQYGSLNQGVWLKLETAIREIKDEKGKDHVWVIVGPIFGDEPPAVYRGLGKNLPIPESYFCVTVDPHMYPFDTPSKVAIDCFIIPQEAPRDANPQDYPASLEVIEKATNLKFFDSWGRDIPIALSAEEQPLRASRLMRALEEVKANTKAEAPSAKALQDAKSIEDLIDSLKNEAALLEVQDRELSIEEKIRLQTLQHSISWLLKARELASDPNALKPARDAEPKQNIITYNIVADLGDKLKNGARTACNFWNRFIVPKHSIVIRLDTFTQNSTTIARAYEPFEKDGVRYGHVEFNTRFLSGYTDDKIAGTIIHEIGHSLGIGWDEWSDLFHQKTGLFKSKAIARLSALRHMEVELDGGPGTALAHWDELKFDNELMTGIQDHGEYVLPVTIDVMKLLGHTLIEQIDRPRPLEELLRAAASMVFSRQDEVRKLDLEYFEKTDLFETIPHKGDLEDDL